MLSAMPVDSLHLFLTMFAMIGGLMIFALLLLAGVQIVKMLQLPIDLPEGPRFEPPPPPTKHIGDRKQAAVTAQAQARLFAFYERAHQAVRAAFETQELQTAIKGAGTSDAVVAARQVIERCAATAKSAGTIVEKSFTDMDKRLRADRQQVSAEELTATQTLIDTQMVTIQSALSEARSAILPLDDGSGNRRLIIMVVVLVVMVVWVILMKTMMKT